MDDIETGKKTASELADVLKEMVLEREYMCLVSVVYYGDGIKVVTHGVPTLELEAGMLAQAVQILFSRLNDVRLAIHAAGIREEKNGAN